MDWWIILLIVIVALAVIGVLMYLGVINFSKHNNSVTPESPPLSQMEYSPQPELIGSTVEPVVNSTEQAVEPVENAEQVIEPDVNSTEKVVEPIEPVENAEQTVTESVVETSEQSNEQSYNLDNKGLPNGI